MLTSSTSTTPFKVYSAIESLAWALLFATALLVTLDTWQADFPARARSLGGEALVLVITAALATLASVRVKAPTSTETGVRLLAYALLALRVFLLLPALAFFLLVAAAGFAA